MTRIGMMVKEIIWLIGKVLVTTPQDERMNRDGVMLIGRREAAAMHCVRMRLSHEMRQKIIQVNIVESELNNIFDLLSNIAQLS